MKKILIFTTVILISQLSFGQWSKGKNKGFYKLSTWYLKTNQHYTNEGKIDPNATRIQFNVNLYTEYGISNKLDVIAYIPFYTRVAQNNILSGTTGSVIQKGEAVSSIGDIDLGFNYNLYRKNNWSASVRFLFGLPTGESNGGSDGSYQTGDGEFNQFLSSLLGYSTKIKNLKFDKRLKFIEKK